MDKIYYIYSHTRLDTGQIFYIGKGKNNRAYSKYDRNTFWRNIVNKHGYEIKILFDSLLQEEAFKIEMEQIAYYKSLGYCEANLTSGGSGGPIRKGMKNSKEMREKQSIAAKGRIVWPTGKKRKPFTEEHKQKLRLAKLGKKRPDLIGKTGPRRNNGIS